MAVNFVPVIVVPENHRAPQGWGPYVWKSAHSLANGFDQALALAGSNEDRKAMIHMLAKWLLYHLMLVLLCIWCRRSLRDYLRDPQGYIMGVDDYRWWIYRLHEKVNHKVHAYEASKDSQKAEAKYAFYQPAFEEVRYVPLGSPEWMETMRTLRAFMEKEITTQDANSFRAYILKRYIRQVDQTVRMLLCQFNNSCVETDQLK